MDFAGVERFDLTLTNGGDDVTTGDGNDRIDGRGGADLMTGGKGDDTYIVDVQGDRAVEIAKGGTDTVRTSVSYILESGQELEVLTTTNDAGKGAIDLTGNERVNTLRGNAGNNLLDGGLAADTITGLGGADTYPRQRQGRSGLLPIGTDPDRWSESVRPADDRRPAVAGASRR